MNKNSSSVPKREQNCYQINVKNGLFCEAHILVVLTELKTKGIFMLSKKLVQFFLIVGTCLGSFNAHALIRSQNEERIANYLVSESSVELDVYILRKSTQSNQVGLTIQRLNSTFKDSLFSADCSATIQVKKGSYTPHSIKYDTDAFGVVSVNVTHNCLSALYKAIGALEANPNIDVMIPTKINPAVTFSN
jgi:hypothetical protein